MNWRKLALVAGLAVGVAGPFITGSYEKSLQSFKFHRANEASLYVREAIDSGAHGLWIYENAGTQGRIRALPALWPILRDFLAFGLAAAGLVAFSQPFARWLRT